MTRFLRVFLLVAAALGSAVAQAQTYPARPITLVVPFAPGSGTDTIARLVGAPLSQALGQNVIIENKAGANGSIAATFVARAAPDGYTLLITTNTTHSANPSLLKSISYDPVKDFAPIALIGNLRFMMVVHPGIPAKSVQEFVAYAKANPGKLSYASGNSTGIVAGETLKRTAGIDLLHVPYKSTPPAINDVLGGRVSMMFIDLATGMPHTNANTLRPLAVSTQERSSILPQLPSMREAGFADFDLTSWVGVFAPAGTSKDVVMRLNGELRRIVASSEVKEKLVALGMDARSSTPEELGDYVNSQLVLWTRMIKDAGIEPQ